MELMRSYKRIQSGALLPQSFFSRDALIVAQELLGGVLHFGAMQLMITETEAYRWPNDSANHCYRGQTARNAPMFGPAGHAYVYLCYGIHHMLNVVTGKSGEGAGVLIRAGEEIPDLLGKEKAVKPLLLNGPGKLGKALKIDRSWSGHAFYKEGGLELRAGRAVTNMLSGPRVGIDYASLHDRSAPYRFAMAEASAVSHRNALQLI